MCKKLQKDLEMKESEYYEIEKMKEQLEKKNKSLSKELSVFKIEVESLEEEKTQIEAQLNAEVVSKDLEISKIRSEQTILEKRIIELESQVKSLEEGKQQILEENKNTEKRLIKCKKRKK